MTISCQLLTCDRICHTFTIGLNVIHPMENINVVINGFVSPNPLAANDKPDGCLH